MDNNKPEEYQNFNDPLTLGYECRIGEAMMSDPDSIQKELSIVNSNRKRKMPDAPNEDSLLNSSVQQNPQFAQLAEQSPVLVSMLAQTPRISPSVPMSMANAIVPQSPQERLAEQSPVLASLLAQSPRISPSVPTSMANAIVPQLPQETLPKNPEKLMHPVNTSTPSSGSTSSNSQYSITMAEARSVFSQPPLQHEVVTSDTRGLVTLVAQNNTDFAQTGEFLGELPPNNSSPSLNLENYQNQYLPNSQPRFLSTNSNKTSTFSDPELSLILQDIFNVEEKEKEKKISKSTEDSSNFVPATIPKIESAQEAINNIRRDLIMSYVPISRNAQQSAPPAKAVHPIKMLQNFVVLSSYTQSNQFPTNAPPAYTVTNNSTQSVHAAGPHILPKHLNVDPTNSQMSNKQGLPQNLNDLAPQKKKRAYKPRQKGTAAQKKQQQQKQQQLPLDTRQAIPVNILPNLQLPTSAHFPEGYLLSNTMAPNVTLQYASSVPEPQLSPQYNVQQTLNASSLPQSPSQLSPGQQPLISPMAQHYPAIYPQSRLIPFQAGPRQMWVPQQRSSQNPASLQQQNPVLHPQHLQASYTGQQLHFANQQLQARQVVVHSMPSPGSWNSPYSDPNQGNLPRGLPAGFTTGNPILAPQASPSHFNPTSSTYNAPIPVSTSSNFSTDNSYNQQVYPSSVMDRNRSNGGNSMTSQYVPKLPALVEASTLQHQQPQHCHHHQQPKSEISVTGTVNFNYPCCSNHSCASHRFL